MSLASVVRNIVEGGLAPDDPRRQDAGFMRRLRTVNGCFLSLLSSVPPTLLTYASLGMWKPVVAVTFSALVNVVALVAIRRGYRIDVAAHADLLVLVALLAFLGTQIGGHTARAVPWVFVPGVLGGLMLDARAAAIYTALGGATITAFHGLHMFGIDFPNYLPPAILPLYDFLMLLMLGAVLLTVVCVFLNAQHEMETALRTANADLEVSRDAAAAAAAVKSEFLATMSHEIRTPMNGIFGMIELAQDTRDDAEREDFLGRARACAERLMAILNDVLDFSKIEAGKLDLESVEFEVRDVVEGVLDTLVIEAAKKKLELVGVVDDELPRRMRGDPGRLQQVIMNLAANALKFTDHGEIVVTLRRVPDGRRAKGAGHMRCEVRDTGIGIPLAQQERIFESFTQADSSTTRCYGGTGLGLAISQRLVALMGGSMGVVSEPGRGSTFWFIVPIDAVDGAPAAADPVEGLRGMRVLVVDDNATNRMVLLKMLQMWGCRAALASGGLEALDLLAHAGRGGEPFDIVLLDVQMPDVDGYATARRIRHDPATRNVPIIALTSISRTIAAEAVELGLAGLLPKPIKQRQLQQAMLAATRAAAGYASSAAAIA